ncbi:MAG TPA: HAD hydrolase-like protein [Actinopolymorphaceae bacterium]|jgi:phosphoglycolate phosphatase
MPSRAPVVLFDLDGTLADPGTSIVSSVVRALELLGEPVPPAHLLRGFVGPPLVDTFAGLGLSAGRVDRAIELYRAHFDAEGIRLYRPYLGMPALVDDLRAAGVTVGIATSKPTQIAGRVLDVMGWRPGFDVLAGATMDSSRSAKADIIALALDELSARGHRADVAVMVGDRRHDIAGAHAHGLPAVGVTWGYGDPAELLTAGADRIVDDGTSLGSVLTDLLVGSGSRLSGWQTTG